MELFYIKMGRFYRVNEEVSPLATYTNKLVGDKLEEGWEDPKTFSLHLDYNGRKLQLEERLEKGLAFACAVWPRRKGKDLHLRLKYFHDKQVLVAAITKAVNSEAF